MCRCPVVVLLVPSHPHPFPWHIARTRPSLRKKLMLSHYFQPILPTISTFPHLHTYLLTYLPTTIQTVIPSHHHSIWMAERSEGWTPPPHPPPHPPSHPSPPRPPPPPPHTPPLPHRSPPPPPSPFEGGGGGGEGPPPPPPPKKSHPGQSVSSLSPHKITLTTNKKENKKIHCFTFALACFFFFSIETIRTITITGELQPSRLVGLEHVGKRLRGKERG